MLTRWFAGPRFRIDLTQAFGWLSQLIAIPEHLNFGPVFSNRPTRIDDLSRIHGIEPANESDLNRIGIYRFKQLVDWDQENIDAVAEAIQCDPVRIKNEWIPQAKRMAT